MLMIIDLWSFYVPHQLRMKNAVKNGGFSNYTCFDNYYPLLLAELDKCLLDCYD